MKAYDPIVRSQDALYFNHEWEFTLVADELMQRSTIPDSVWDRVVMDPKDNPIYDPGIPGVSGAHTDVRTYKRRLVVVGHNRPKLVPKEIWVPGDYILAENPQALLNRAVARHYYHPILLMEGEPTSRDEAVLREALDLPSSDSIHDRPAVLLGENPKRHRLPRVLPNGSVVSSDIDNPLGPVNFPWAISILTTARALPRDSRDWVAGDWFRSEAYARNSGERKMYGRGARKLLTMKDIIWGRLLAKRVFLDILPRSYQERAKA